MSPFRAPRWPLRHLDLLPFVVAAGAGATVLAGWWGGQVAWVQPRSHDQALSANAALCLLLLGLSPLWARVGYAKVAMACGIGAAALALVATLNESLLLGLDIDNWLATHANLVEGVHTGRIPHALAWLFVAMGGSLAWLAYDSYANERRPLLLALLGSVAGAYGIAALLAGRIGLIAVEGWMLYAHTGPISATTLVVLSVGLILVASRDSSKGHHAGNLRWLWLPIVISGATVTLLFWVSLRERETAYLNNTTQLTINNIAAVFSSETETQINTLQRMSARWTDAGGTPLASWERDARAVSLDFPAYRSLSWVDANLRTRWLWPQSGNEDAASFDHSRHPLRVQAMNSARDSLTYSIAAPLVSPIQGPSFVVYSTVLNAGTFDGFIVGEIGFQRLFELIDARLNISSRYEMNVRLLDPFATDIAAREVSVYTSQDREQHVNERLRQAAVFNLMGHRFTFELLPRPEYIAPNRQYLPELALASGLGVSVLLALVFNLAQSARRRQQAAESTSAQLRAENEERRRIEAQLKVADERLNLALDATQVGVVEWDLADGRALFSNGFWTSLGYDAMFMAPAYDTLLKLIHPDDLEGYRAALDQHLAGKSDLVEHEFRIRHHNGDWLWFYLRAKCVGTDRAGRPRRVAGTFQNVSARKSAQEALRASQAATRKLSLVASRTDNAVVITRADGRIEWVNESFSRLTGHTLEDISGRIFIELLSSPEADLTAVERVTAAFTRHETITTDVIHHGRSGRRYHVHLELQPVKNEDGSVENFIVMETDITSRVEVEQQLRRAKVEADSASRAKSEFLASMSHEIRTPMNGVIGMTSLLMETPLTPEQRDYVQTIRTSGDALLAIINEILDFSKIESGRMELEQHPFELAQCVEESLDIFALQAATKDIELAYAIDADVPAWIVGDITRLRQVLVNLVNNAVKFTPRGFITIEVKLATPLPRSGGPVLLDFLITDTGIGIPADRQGALFKPFSQVDSSTTRKYGGTGLGLAICDRLAQLMGGSIDVTSVLGQGSRFRFSIQTEAAPDPAPITAFDLRGAVVLAVDDHPVNRRALATVLATWNCTPHVVATPAEALAAAERQAPDLIIVDHDLAGERGENLLGQLRTRFPVAPAVLFTAATDGVRQGQSVEPFVVRLPKPIKPAFLGEAVVRLVHGVGSKSHPSHTPGGPDEKPSIRLGESVPLDILLVEDNPVNQKVALHLLERLGFHADAVGNGLEAVRTLQQRDYDLVFMDVQMPEMDGMTATREIRAKLPASRQPKIIALTANAIQGDRERCLAAGMDAYIAKPVKLDELHAVIARYFVKTPAH